jgi:hypothetical protein
MSIHVVCICGYEMARRDYDAGRRVKCHGCGELVLVPQMKGDHTDTKSIEPAPPTHLASCDTAASPDDAVPGAAEDGGRNQSRGAHRWRVILAIWGLLYAVTFFTVMAVEEGSGSRQDDAGKGIMLVFTGPTLFLAYYGSRALGRRRRPWMAWCALAGLGALRLAWLGAVRRSETDRYCEPGETGIEFFAWFNPLQVLLFMLRPRLCVADREYPLRFWHTAFVSLPPGRHTIEVYFRYFFWRCGWQAAVVSVPRDGRVSYCPNVLAALLAAPPMRIRTREGAPNKPLQPTSGGHAPGESGSMGRAARG